jgi:hypothetical protein
VVKRKRENSVKRKENKIKKGQYNKLAKKRKISNGKIK